MKRNENDHVGHKSNGDVKDKAGIDVQSVVSMEILESDAETRNEEVLRRVAEMQELVENSEQYLNRHQRESSDSDGSHISSDGSVSLPPPPANPGQLKHSDSLLLLAQVRSLPAPKADRVPVERVTRLTPVRCCPSPAERHRG